MIQENQESGGQPKPLRITGEPEKVENARRMVEEILQSREDHPPGRFNFLGLLGIGSGQRSIGEVRTFSCFVHENCIGKKVNKKKKLTSRPSGMFY